MKQRTLSHQRTPTISDSLRRIVNDAKNGKVAEANSAADVVAVQIEKQRSFGKSAVPDTAYDPRSAAVRAAYQAMTPARVAKSGVAHCNDDDYGPPTSDEHKLAEWIDTEVTRALERGLPPVVAARRCAARMLAKNAKRYSTYRRDAVSAMNELLLRLGSTELLTMHQAFGEVPMPSDATVGMEPDVGMEPEHVGDAEVEP